MKEAAFGGEGTRDKESVDDREIKRESSTLCPGLKAMLAGVRHAWSLRTRHTIFCPCNKHFEGLVVEVAVEAEEIIRG